MGRVVEFVPSLIETFPNSRAVPGKSVTVVTIAVIINEAPSVGPGRIYSVDGGLQLCSLAW